MRLEPPDSPQRMGEERRYFPDWTSTARLRQAIVELEADHNSYMAGGYAEEFGYRAQPGFSRGVPVLDGEPPEELAEWQAQAVATHPGYPITPHPIVLEPDGIERETPKVSAGEVRREINDHGTFIRVTDRQYERERHRPAQRAAAALTRFLAAAAAFVWELPRRRRVL